MHSPGQIDFQVLFEATPGLYLILLPDLTIAAVNDSYAKATMTRREEIVGRGLFEVFPDNPDDPGATGVSNLSKSINHVLKNKTAHTMAVQKYDIRRPDGSFEERFWSPLNKPVLDESGNILYIIHRVEDVTEFVLLKREGDRQLQLTEDMRGQIREMEMEIYNRSQEIQERNKELELFTYSVSHDLRAPLRIINGYTGMLTDDYKDKLDEEGKRILGVVQQHVGRMERLIGALLKFSKIGRQELSVELTDMENLVKGVVEEQVAFSTLAPSIKQDKLLPVHCDGELMRHVWANLVSNAVKYSAKVPKPEIEISSSKEDGRIIYSVKDNGVGFDMKHAQNLFGVFQRLHKETEYEGTGIGLALAHKILSKHGGKIWVEAAKDEGATFYFSLPV